MSHNEYWKSVRDKAHARLQELFSECDTHIEDIVDDESGIDSYIDAKRVLAFALRHASTSDERACAILSVGEALHSWHELQESTSTNPLVR